MTKMNEPRTIDAVQTTLEIIERLQELDNAGVTELANELGLSKGTVHCHLATLIRNDYVTKDGEKYQLSLRYLDLAETVKDRLEIYDVIKTEVDDLAEESNNIAQFAMEEHGHAVYLYKARGKKDIQTASSIGKREHLHCISLGKAMLAHFPEERVDEIVERHGLPKYTDQTITTRDELIDELERVRDRGYAIDDEEVIEGLRCIAAPVKRADGSVLGAVSVSGPSTRMNGDAFEEDYPAMVKNSANVIEINAKFS